ncbi:MAG: hypothetical protein DMG65_23580 [Candidatus Angelobacter sp. Gp1-AA117]|nr:MAG: hypothetical protein DMG65_23580 [Candidatus Angelobacter sp. Gp1-AA117]
MTITCQENSYHKEWQYVIADAEEEIAGAKRRIMALKASIRRFHEQMKAGKPLPEGLKRVKEKAGMDSASIPA